MKILITVVCDNGDNTGVPSHITSIISTFDNPSQLPDTVWLAIIEARLEANKQNVFADKWKVKSVCHSILPE